MNRRGQLQGIADAVHLMPDMDRLVLRSNHPHLWDLLHQVAAEYPPPQFFPEGTDVTVVSIDYLDRN